MRFLYFSIVVLITEIFIAFGHYVSPNDCSRSFLGRQNSGVIKSYNFPFDYSHNLTCTYRIYLDVEANSTKTICFTFYRFSLETSSPFCSFDYLLIGFPNALKYCGVGLWQYGLEDRRNLFSNIWSSNLCWSVNVTGAFDVTFSTDNSISSSGFFAKFRVFDSLGVAGPSPADRERNLSLSMAPCHRDDWTCFNQRCIPRNLLCNSQNDCGDGSDETYAHARCRGQTIVACDFSSSGSGQNFCEMTHDGWRISARLEYQRATLVDHTNGTGGNFLYTDKSASRAISSQLMLNANSSYCLTFWYYMIGESSSLAIYVAPEQAYSRPEWSHGTRKGKWTMGEIYIDQRSSIQVIFSANHDSNGAGLVAIDDISILDGDCSGVDISCNFESGFCGWSSVSQLSHGSGILRSSDQWSMQRQGATTWDHSSVDGYGYYLFVELPVTSDSSERQAVFLSPAISAEPHQRKCLKLWYIVKSATAGHDCTLSVALLQFDNVLTADVWNQSIDGMEVWRQARIDVETDGPFQIVLISVKRSLASCKVFLDKIVLDDNSCRLEGNVECNTSEFLCEDGQCVSRMLLCDQIPHCIDGADESSSAGCPRSSPEYFTLPTTFDVRLCGESSSMFLCQDKSSCIPQGYICDGVNDCSDSSDELPFAGCSDLSPVSVATTASLSSLSLSSSSARSSSRCNANEFRCMDGSCLVAEKRCDGRRDCSNGQDEQNCPVAQHLLSPGAIAGISVGCFLACFLVVLSCALFAVKRRRKKSKGPIQSHSSVEVSSVFTTPSLNQVSENPVATQFRQSSESLELPYNAPASRPNPVCGSLDGARVCPSSPSYQNSIVAPLGGQRRFRKTLPNVCEANHSANVRDAIRSATDSPEPDELPEDRPGFPHNRHFYRSLPPIPMSPSSISPLLEALLENQRRRRQRPASSTPSSRNLSLVSEHIYEEPVYAPPHATGSVIPARNAAPVHSSHFPPFHLSSQPISGPFIDRSEFPSIHQKGIPSIQQPQMFPPNLCDMKPSNIICVTAFPVNRPTPSSQLTATPSVAFAQHGDTRHHSPPQPAENIPSRFFQTGIPEIPDIPVQFSNATNSRLWEGLTQDPSPFPVVLPERSACGSQEDGHSAPLGESDWDALNGFHSRMNSSESSGNRSSSPLVPCNIGLNLDCLPNGTSV